MKLSREQELLRKICSLYEEYTGQEIAKAIGEYRAQVQAREEQAKIKAEIAELEQKLD